MFYFIYVNQLIVCRLGSERIFRSFLLEMFSRRPINLAKVIHTDWSEKHVHSLYFFEAVVIIIYKPHTAFLFVKNMLCRNLLSPVLEKIEGQYQNLFASELNCVSYDAPPNLWPMKYMSDTTIWKDVDASRQNTFESGLTSNRHSCENIEMMPLSVRCTHWSNTYPKGLLYMYRQYNY